MIETPRLLKKPGGEYKRVENQVELDAALAEGWFVRLPVAPLVVLTDAPLDLPVEAQEPLVESPEDVPEPPEEGDEMPASEPEGVEPPKKRGRPRKNS